MSVEAIVLASGVQRRFGGSTSKMMFDVNGRPAVDHLIGELLEVFASGSITFVISESFPDLEEFLREVHPTIRILYDENPGSGTYRSFRGAISSVSGTSFFVTEGDIFYSASLVREMLESLVSGVSITVAGTPNVYVAPTHRKLRRAPPLISESNDSRAVELRNVGCYTLSEGALATLPDDCENLIDALRLAELSGEVTRCVTYSGIYLHTADPTDIQLWRDALSKYDT